MLILSINSSYLLQTKRNGKVILASYFWHIRSPLLTLIFISVVSPLTIRDWNALPDSLISSAESAEDGVAKFTSLVRAGD